MRSGRSTNLLRPPIGAAATVAFLAAVVIVAVGFWQLQRSRREILDHARDDVRILSHALAQHAARTIEAVDLTLEDVAERAARNATTDAGLAEFIRQRVARLSQVRNLAVVRPDGSWRADALSGHVPMTSADRQYFVWHRDHPGPDLHIEEPIASRTTGKPSIPLSRRLNNPDGSFGGLVIATLAPEYLNEIYQQVRNGRRGTVSVWLQDGRLLDRYPPVVDPKPDAAAAASASAAQFFTARTGASLSVSPFDGVERLFAFEHIDDLPVVVSASVSTEDALAGWRHDVLTEGTVFGGSALLLIVLGVGLEGHRRRHAILLVISQAADKRCRMLADNTHDMITHMALDGTRLYVSPASRELLGQDPESLVGTNPKNAVHPDDAAQLRSVLEDLRTGVKDHAVNINRLRHRDGRWIWVEASLRLLRDHDGQAASIVAAVRDVTDRQQAVEALRESETRYRVLAETTTDVITLLDASMHRRYVSPACRHLLGYEPEEMLGLRPSAQIHPDDAHATRTLAQRLLAGEIVGDRTVTTYRTRHKEGHWIWVEAALSLVRHTVTNAPLSIICSLRDITERQRVAHQLERARAAAEAAGRAKTEFVANMSHELRTPLTGILGVLDLLRRDPTLTAEQRRLIGLAGDSGTSLLSIVNDVLDFSKVEAGQLTLEAVPFALDQLAASCCGLVAEGLKGRPVELRTTIAPAAHRRYRGDPTRLRQVLLNLLLNAAKFTERGHITLAMDYHRANGLLRVDVTDTGIGFPPESADSLFERFAQADTSMTRRFGGTGLGLAICKRLVGLMGGRIAAEAVAGGGSNFFFEVPLQEFQDADGADRPFGADPATAIGGTLLLAEDNSTNADIIAAMLTARGYVVSIVADGAAAVEAAAREPAPALILMDLQMPVMDGLTAAAAIRSQEAERCRRRVPIIGLTANAMAEDAARCRAGGMDAHVAKPVLWSELFAIIDRLLGHAEPDSRAA